MSQSDVFDEWDDFTPDIQDDLFEKLEHIESKSTVVKSIKVVDENVKPNTTTFSVFLDPPTRVYKHTTVPLLQVKTNQRQTITTTCDKFKVVEKKKQPVMEQNSQEDEGIWGDLDVSNLPDIVDENEKSLDSVKEKSMDSEKEKSVESVKENPKNSMKEYTVDSLKEKNRESTERQEPTENRVGTIDPKLEFGGFVTAGSRKKIEPKKESREKARRLWASIEPIKENKVEPTLIGFTTASGKQLKKVSEEAQKKAVDLFSTGFATASGKSIEPISDNSKLKVLDLLQQKRPLTLSDTNKYEDILNKYGGFQMGQSNKGIPVSAESKRQAVELLVPKKKSTRNSFAFKQNKPFKSPIIQSNLELTRAAVKNKPTSRLRDEPVFDLTCPLPRYSLSTLGPPLQYTRDQLLHLTIPNAILEMTYTNATLYRFNDKDWGTSEAHNELIEAGAHRATLPWVKNHYGLIVWKLACLIRSYPKTFQLTPNTVLNQLLYRYEREMNLGHRPVLRKVLEQDDVSIKHMVLVISDIISIKTPVHAYTSSKYLLQLTDGWYTVFACIDERMERTIQQNRLHIGHKLSICGSQLVGDKTPQSPLMIQRETMLHITTNGCLPVPWDTKLGYHPRKLVPRDLGSLFEDGGTVTVIDIIVCRKYPILFTETLSDGTTITRTAKEEEAFRRPFETVQERKVAGYFRVRMCDHHKSSDEWATLLLVNASEIHHLDVVEGNRYRVFFITPYLPRVKRYPGMHFKTSRMTRWESVQVNKDVKNTYIPRFISSCGSIKKSKESSQTEFDVVVFILHVGLATLETNKHRRLWHQTLLVTDQTLSVCQINLKLPLHPFASSVKHQIIGFTNLKYNSYDAKFDITCVKATADETEVYKSVAPEYIQQSSKELRVFIDEHKQELEVVMTRIQSIVNE